MCVCVCVYLVAASHVEALFVETPIIACIIRLSLCYYSDYLINLAAEVSGVINFNL